MGLDNYFTAMTVYFSTHVKRLFYLTHILSSFITLITLLYILVFDPSVFDHFSVHVHTCRVYNRRLMFLLRYTRAFTLMIRIYRADGVFVVDVTRTSHYILFYYYRTTMFFVLHVRYET